MVMALLDFFRGMEARRNYMENLSTMHYVLYVCSNWLLQRAVQSVQRLVLLECD